MVNQKDNSVILDTLSPSSGKISITLPFPALDAQFGSCRSIPIKWKVLFDTGIIVADELVVLEKLSHSEFDFEDSCTLIITVLNALQKVYNTKQDDKFLLHCLSYIYDILDYDPFSLSRSKFQCDELFDVLRRLLVLGCDTISAHSARVLSVLIFGLYLSKKSDSLGSQNVTVLLDWIESTFSKFPDNEQLPIISTLCMEHLFRIPSFRDFALQHYSEGIILPLCSNISFSKNSQLQYQSLFSIWLLTFDKKCVEVLQEKFSIIQSILKLAKKYSPLKIKNFRLCVGIWKNCLIGIPDISKSIMIGSKLFDYLIHGAHTSSAIADHEILSDISFIKETLSNEIQSLNSFDEYVSEIKSGKLSWSPPHKSEVFWLENSQKLAADNYEILNRLSMLLDLDDDPLSTAIAAHDIGMYCAFYLNGRSDVENLHIKPKLMSLISHTDPEVRYQSLTAMQKYMKKLWNPVAKV